jgi:hypothetical protein
MFYICSVPQKDHHFASSEAAIIHGNDRARFHATHTPVCHLDTTAGYEKKMIPGEVNAIKSGAN